MIANGIKTGKFSEELYFILMSGQMRPKIKALAEKYGFTDRELRNRILRSVSLIVDDDKIMPEDEFS